MRGGNARSRVIRNGLRELSDPSNRSASIRHETGWQDDVSIRAGEYRLQCMCPGRKREG